MEYEIPKSSLRKKSILSFLPNLYPTCTMFQIRESSAIDEILAIEKRFRQVREEEGQLSGWTR
jgi:hypothetical protein